MAEHERMPGISDLLCGETAFGDAIHRDRLSDAHIVPQGVSDLERAMRGADRLTMIIDALADAYDLVLVECGSADKSALNRVVRGDSEVILSVPGYDDEAIAELVEEYAEAGYSGLLVLSEDDQPSRRAHRSSAA
jgi:Mrp family chromosome partitioning ATPase